MDNEPKNPEMFWNELNLLIDLSFQYAEQGKPKGDVYTVAKNAFINYVYLYGFREGARSKNNG